eukprot:NODE_26_length_35450_cov_0.398320.p8 type:complete len:353 gc:universal NODE_26_length_35450_cov_0.398320:7675-6617(-)
MTKENITSFLKSISVVHQWPIEDHLRLLLEIDPKHFKKCMQLMDVRYFTLKIINSHIQENPKLKDFITMSAETKTLIKVERHPCLLQKNHYSLLEKILVQLNRSELLEYGLKYIYHLPHPEKLFGILLNLLEPTNQSLLSCLEALMFLMVKKNLQVELFYSKVYELLPFIVNEPNGLELVNTILNSIGLSHVYLRNYFKLLCSVAVLCDLGTCSRIAVVLCNLIRKFKPALWDLIHDTSPHNVGEYSATSEHTNQAYEIKALQKHYHADISGLFDSFGQQWIDSDHKSSKKRAMWNLEDVEGIDYNCKDFEKTVIKEKIQEEMIYPEFVEINGRTMKKAPKLWMDGEHDLFC